MISLNTTWDTVGMLMIAGGVGLLGGIAAALLELRSAKDGKASGCGFGTFMSSVFLGGVAAVAILYFFPPQENIPAPGGAGGTVAVYNLTKLVALALIVGSAGTAFLLAMQARGLAALKAERTDATQATASEMIKGLGDQASALAKAGVKEASPMIQKALEDATKLNASQITPKKVAGIVEDLGNQAEESVGRSMEPAVEVAKSAVVAASTATEAEAVPDSQ